MRSYVCWPTVLLATSLMFPVSAGEARGAGVPAQVGSTAQRILQIVDDKTKTPEQKIGALAGVSTKFTPQDIDAAVKLLGRLDGQLLLAVAVLAERGGAAKQVFEAMVGTAYDRQSPVSRWAQALCFVRSRAPMHLGPKALRHILGTARQVAERLEKPTGKDELLAVLRERQALWQKGGGFADDEQVVRCLCALLRHADREVRAGAAEALSNTSFPEMIPGSAVLPLTGVVGGGDEAGAKAAAALLAEVVGTGPEQKELAAVRTYWGQWAREAGDDFDLAKHAIARASEPHELFFQERAFLGRQVLHACRELDQKGREEAWRSLLRVFERDTSPPRERAGAWLGPLVQIAAREEEGNLRREALALLLKLSRADEPALRWSALSYMGHLPGATRRGSPTRKLLEGAMGDAKGRPWERAVAAWSLRDAVKEDRALAQRMIALAEEFVALPESAFAPMSRSHSIGQLSGALSHASGKDLSLDPATWRAALGDWLPTDK